MAVPYSENGAQVFSLCLAFTILASISVIARIFTRAVLVQNLGKDDYVMIVSWIFAVVCGVMIMLQAENGLGHHLKDLTPENVTTVLQFFYWSIPFYYASLSLTKITIVFQTLRFVTPSQKKSRLACWIMIGVIVGYLVYTEVTTFIICIPAEFFWDKTVGGTCLDFLALWFVNAALNIVTDVAILIIPLRIILQVQLPRKQKMWLVLVFAIGGIVCVSSILRLQSLYIVSISTDPTFDNSAAAYWSDIEMNLAIICCCMPTLRPLLARCTSRLVDSSYAARSRLTGQRPPSTPGLLNSQPLPLHAHPPQPLSPGIQEYPMKNIMVTTEIKQNFSGGAVEKDASISSDGNGRSLKDSEFV